DGALEAGVAARIEVEQARVIGQPAEGASLKHGGGGGGIESALAAVLGVEGFGLGPPQAPLLPMSGGHDVHGGDGERGCGLEIRLDLVEDLGEILDRFAVDDEVAGVEVVGAAVLGRTALPFHSFRSAGLRAVGTGGSLP